VRAGRWTELIYVALAALLLFGAYAWLAHYGIDVTDEGYFLDLASRVQHGQLPYRDFDTYYTPGLFYVNAAILHVFGSNVLPSRILLAAIRLACALVVYGLARRLAPAPFAAVPALIVALMALLVGVHPGWPALLATLLLMDVLARADATRNRRWLLAAGIISGGAFLFKKTWAPSPSSRRSVTRSPPLAGPLPPPARTRGVRRQHRIVDARVFSSALDPLLSTVLWLPLVGTLLVLLVWRTPQVRSRVASLWTGRPCPRRPGLRPERRGDRPVAVPLSALGPQSTPFALFLGSVTRARSPCARAAARHRRPRSVRRMDSTRHRRRRSTALARLLPPFAVAALATRSFCVPTRAAGRSTGARTDPVPAVGRARRGM
jgi:hypothetical protein